jgi:hypothetical protein
MPERCFIASVLLWLVSFISGWALYFLGGPRLVAIVPCLLLTAACVTMIRAVDLHEAQTHRRVN